jgi:hypothetical protein
MRVFLLDLWLDLREKRLAPLAIALLAGVILVPIVLAKGSDESPPPEATTARTPSSGSPVVKSEPQEGPVESKLESFNPRDPFEPTSAAAGSTGGESSGGGTGSSESGGGSTGGGGETTSTGGGITGAGEPGTTGGATTGGGTTGGGTTGGGTTGGGTTTERKTTFYTYTVDLRFGEPGDVKSYKDVKRLELIPSEDDPKIVFLGVTTTGKTAVFLVDSSLGVDTEGACKPSRDECTFLYLRPDADHDTAVLTDADGNTFDVRLRDIHRVIVSSANGSNPSTGNRSPSSNRSPAFTGSTRQDGESAPAGSAPPGEPSKPFTFRGFFGDESR